MSGLQKKPLALRDQVEEKLRSLESLKPETFGFEEIQQLVHELRVHQIELEIQNENLRQSHMEIEASRARFVDLYDLAPVGYVTVSEEGIVLETNLTAVTMLRVPRNTLIKQPLVDFILPEDQDTYFFFRKALFETKEPQKCELRLVHSDNGPFWVMLEATAAKESDKFITRIVMSDITMRKHKETALSRSQKLAQNILESAPNLIYIYDLQEKRHVYSNQGMVNILGYSPKGVSGQEKQLFDNILHPDDFAEVGAHHDRLSSSPDDQVWELEYRMRHAKGHWVTLRCKDKPFLRDDQGKVIQIIGTAEDITNRRQIEEAQALLAQTSSGDSVEHFFHVVAKFLVESLDMNFVSVDLFVGDGLTVRTVATWSDGHCKDNVTYALKDTPCSVVMDKGICCFSAGVCKFFPHDQVLKDLRAESFVGVTILGRTNLPIGLMSVIGRTPLTNPSLAEAILKLIAVRASRELERMNAKEVLQESEEKFRLITETIEDVFWIIDIVIQKILYVSPAYETIWGLSRDSLYENPGSFLDTIHPDDRERVRGCLLREQKNGQPFEFEYRIARPDGTIRWIHDRRFPIRTRSGAVVHFTGVAKDITEYKQSEERLFKSMATLTTLFDGISDSLIMVDAGHRIKRINRAAKDYFGLNGYQEAIGKFCYEVGRDRSIPCEECEHPFSEMIGYSGVYERKNPLKPDKIERVVVDVVRDETGTPMASIIRILDITQERLMERQLVQSEKLASLGLLIAGIAHEINNPNNFIYFNTPILRSYIQFLMPIVDEYVSIHPDLEAFNQPYTEFREDCFKLLDNIEHGSIRINQIVGNLQEFVYERGKGEKRRIDLKQVIEKGISICLGRIKKAVKTFEVDIPIEGVLIVNTDPLAVEQVVVNLLVNAIHAMDKDDSWIKLTLIVPKDPEGKVIIEVADNGCGMDTKTQNKIFDPFFTTKAVGVGTGLGLSISYRLVMELGGHIEVQSEVGKGSIFRVVLPEKSP